MNELKAAERSVLHAKLSAGNFDVTDLLKAITNLDITDAESLLVTTYLIRSRAGSLIAGRWALPKEPTIEQWALHWKDSFRLALVEQCTLLEMKAETMLPEGHPLKVPMQKRYELLDSLYATRKL